MSEAQECAYYCTIDLYRTKFDMAGLKRALQSNKSVSCGNCGSYFNQKYVRFDRMGTAICPSCVIIQKIGKIEEGLDQSPPAKE